MRSKIFRNSLSFLKNNFDCEGKWGFPIIKPQEISTRSIQLISYSDISSHDTYNLEKGVHFFIDDYRFESLYTNPERALPKLKKYAFTLTPDFSLYAEMPLWHQIENIGKNRWLGAYWQEKGLKVIPTVSWSLSQSFEFCFDGLPYNSIIAVGMIGCKRSYLNFMHGYDAMLDKLEPKNIIVFGKPFKEMEGNLISIDYLNSREVIR